MPDKSQIDHVRIKGNGDVRCKMCAQGRAQIFTSMIKQELQSFRNTISKVMIKNDTTRDRLCMEIRTGPRLLRKRTLKLLMKAKFSQTGTKSLTPIKSHSQLAEITQRVVKWRHTGCYWRVVKSKGKLMRGKPAYSPKQNITGSVQCPQSLSEAFSYSRHEESCWKPLQQQ